MYVIVASLLQSDMFLQTYLSCSRQRIIPVLAYVSLPVLTNVSRPVLANVSHHVPANVSHSVLANGCKYFCFLTKLAIPHPLM